MYITFDIGGTNTRIAVSKDGKTLSEPIIYPTPPDFDAGIEKCIQTVQQLSKGEKITAIAGGIPGLMNREKSMLLTAPNLKGWVNKPLKKVLEEKLNTNAILENDTAVWGVGEATQGAGKGYGIMAYITVSTGIGGTRIIDGNIDRSSQGFEPGHHIIDPNGPQCGCGGIGHLEALASGTAVQKKYGKNPKEIKNPKIWDEVTKYLAIGLLNASMFWSPECIVLGGSMMRDISLENVEKYMKEYNFILPSLPILKKSELGDTGGLIGALQLACYNTEYGPLNRSTSL